MQDTLSLMHFMNGGMVSMVILILIPPSVPSFLTCEQLLLICIYIALEFRYESQSN